MHTHAPSHCSSGSVLLASEACPSWQALALSLLPLEGLTATAEDQLQACEALGIQCTIAFQDALAQAILDWFKASFFTWVRCSTLLPVTCLQLSCVSVSTTSQQERLWPGQPTWARCLLVELRHGQAECLWDKACPPHSVSIGTPSCDRLLLMAGEQCPMRSLLVQQHQAAPHGRARER